MQFKANLYSVSAGVPISISMSAEMDVSVDNSLLLKMYNCTHILYKHPNCICTRLCTRKAIWMIVFEERLLPISWISLMRFFSVVQILSASVLQSTYTVSGLAQWYNNRKAANPHIGEAWRWMPINFGGVVKVILNVLNVESLCWIMQKCCNQAANSLLFKKKPSMSNYRRIHFLR